jgi:hypothetical protein
VCQPVLCIEVVVGGLTDAHEAIEHEMAPEEINKVMGTPYTDMELHILLCLSVDVWPFSLLILGFPCGRPDHTMLLGDLYDLE